MRKQTTTNVMYYRLFILSLLMLVLSTDFAQANETPTYHRVTAKNGDGILSLLRRYHLVDQSCNINKFYELNNLRRNQSLVKGRLYYIPILLYKYNGKSIRSTIGVDEWQRAVRIQKYNERILEEKLRRMTFQKSKILWVPYHEMDCGKLGDIGKIDNSTSTNETEADFPKEEEREKMDENEDLIITPEDELEPENNKTERDPIDLPDVVTTSGTRQFPIFGPKYAYTPLESTQLRGQVFYVVAGHGGPDPGAMGKRGAYTLCEDEYAYDVALRLCRLLVANGATAYMITRDPNDGIRDDSFLKCDYDEVLWGNIKMLRAHKPRLFQRSDIVNELYKKHEEQGVKDQKLVAIHIDSRNRGEQTDLFFYYFPGKDKDRKLALNLHHSMKRNYKRYQRNRVYHGTVTARDLHMLRETPATSVYVELGNIRNSFDQKRFVLKSNRDALAKWLFQGLVK